MSTDFITQAFTWLIITYNKTKEKNFYSSSTSTSLYLDSYKSTSSSFVVISSNLGKSSFINGTGFVIKKELIDKNGYDPKTVTEDIEFVAMCAINGEKIAFNDEAITYDEQVNKFIPCLLYTSDAADEL